MAPDGYLDIRGLRIRLEPWYVLYRHTSQNTVQTASCSYRTLILERKTDSCSYRTLYRQTAVVTEHCTDRQLTLYRQTAVVKEHWTDRHTDSCSYRTLTLYRQTAVPLPGLPTTKMFDHVRWRLLLLLTLPPPLLPPSSNLEKVVTYGRLAIVPRSYPFSYVHLLKLHPVVCTGVELILRDIDSRL
ncbi:hypothetical protein J6590_024088 [Homalodisca vitripennis]|nr:hypothetical protein J6590_024088 [Homalodisca vitripennis]